MKVYVFGDKFEIADHFDFDTLPRIGETVFIKHMFYRVEDVIHRPEIKDSSKVAIKVGSL